MQQQRLLIEGLLPDALNTAGRVNLPLLFPTILADPPWETMQRGSRGARRHYPLMTTEQ
jgi:hypothetical protein